MALIIIQKYKLIFLRAVINELDLKKKKRKKKMLLPMTQLHKEWGGG